MKVAIFDMDGTLIDSQHDITVSINHVREQHYGLEPLSNRFVVNAINAPERNLAQLFYGTHAYEAKDRLLFESHYHEQCVENVVLYEGVGELLAHLHDTGIKISVATNAPSLFANRMLTHLGVSHYFDRIIGADMVTYPKPDGEMLQQILSHYHFHPREDQAWMVGDNTKDIAAASHVGIASIFATWGFSDEGTADHVVSHPSGVRRIITPSE